MKEGATYFVMPSPMYGEYPKNGWLVFASRDDQPNWWQLIARFTEESRARLYADIENDSQVTEADPVPSGLNIPPSALEKIAAAVKSGHIFAAPVTVPTLVPAAIQTTVEASQVAESRPKLTKTKSKKPNAHFPSDKWDELATKRLTNLRAEGRPFGEISKILNEEFPGRGYTKAACTGKADRLGLPKPFDTKDETEDEDVSLSDAVLDEMLNEPAKPEITGPVIQSNLLTPDPALDDGAFPLSDVLIEDKSETPVSPEQVNEAIRWYRSLAHAVYKMKDGTIQVDHGACISPAEFLALVNPERERMSMPPFVEQQEAAD